MKVSSARAIFIYEVLWYARPLWGGCKSGENGPSPRNAGKPWFSPWICDGHSLLSTNWRPHDHLCRHAGAVILSLSFVCSFITTLSVRSLSYKLHPSLRTAACSERQKPRKTPSISCSRSPPYPSPSAGHCNNHNATQEVALGISRERAS